jgi:arylsulfatase A
MSRLRLALFAALLSLLVSGLFATDVQSAEKPNFVVIFIDDMGYGDIGPFGSTLNATPQLDKMAEEGMRLTSFYAAPVCSASRAQILTGCYAPRVSVPGVFFPAGRNGLNPDEVTIAEYLGELGYATACVGKWHLGDQPEFLPTNQGFDHYFGIPYSNDMQRVSAADGRRVVPLLRDDKVAELLDDEQQRRVTREYTHEAIKFIEADHQRPFFLYLPHTAMHVPLFPHEDFVGKSTNGKYGDWVAEVDWSVGQILEALRRTNLDENTLVLFTTDNGPWASKGADGGVSGPLRGSKGCTLEGGVRVPTIAWWPGTIEKNVKSTAISGTTDVLPTLVALAGAHPQWKNKIDGRDLTPVLKGGTDKSPREAWYYYQGNTLQAVRSGPWKLAITPQTLGMGIGEKPADLRSREPRLYNLDKEIGEITNVASANPDVVSRLTSLAAAMVADIGSGSPGPGVRPSGVAANPVTLYPTTNAPRRKTPRAGQPIKWDSVKQGGVYASDSIGRMANRSIHITLDVDIPKADTMLLAHGGTAAGYAIYTKAGQLVWAVRLSGDSIGRVSIPVGDVTRGKVEVALTGKGMRIVAPNGKIASSDFAGLLQRQPQESFCVGHDNGNPVDADAPRNANRGKLYSLDLKLGK